MQNDTTILEDKFGGFLPKLNIVLPYGSGIALFGMNPKELKTYVYTKTCTWMLIVALSIIAKT